MIRSLALICAASVAFSGSAVQDKSAMQEPPAVVKRVDPAYPKPIPKDSAQGSVFIKMIIDSKGDVSSATVVKSDVASTLSAAAVEAARQWKFAPAPSGAKRTDIEVVVPFKFKLEDGKKKK